MLNLTLAEQTSSAEVSWLIHGWVNRNRNSMPNLSRPPSRPPNERYLLQISFRSGDLTPTHHSIRSDRSGNHRPPPSRLPVPSEWIQYLDVILKAWGDWTLFQELLTVLRSIGDRHGGVSIANVATRWVLDQPAVGAVIIGGCYISSHPFTAAHPYSLSPRYPPSIRHVISFLYYVLRHHHHLSTNPSTRSNRPDLDRFCSFNRGSLSVLSRRPDGNRRTQGRQQEGVQLLFDRRRQCGHSSRFEKIEQAHSDDR